MTDSRKKQLTDLGAEKIADVLLDFAGRYDEINNCVDWLIASQDEKSTLVKAKIAELHLHDDFIDWRHAAEFERKIDSILDDIRSLNPSPEIGLNLVTDFFRTDSAVIEGCDSDSIGDIYTSAAVLFAEFACHCDDKEKVIELILELLRDDKYAVRGDILKHGRKFLPKSGLKILFDRISEEFDVSGHRLELAELARQMKDVELFVSLNSDPKTGEVYRPTLLSIAELCFDCGKFREALTWLDKIPENGYVPSDFKKKLLNKLGMNKEVEAMCRKSFLAYPCPEALAELLQAIGKDKETTVVAEAVEIFVREELFFERRLEFLMLYGSYETASEYVIQRWRKVDGGNYSSLNSLGVQLKQKGYPLAATIILRALLNSILERKNTKAYCYGAKYWHELAKLAPAILEWRDVPSHEQYSAQIISDHKRKYSFWEEVNQ